MQRLRRHAVLARGAYAMNTERALRADIAQFSAWCAASGRTPLPATAETLAAFIDAMASCRKPATVRRYVASIAAFHAAAELPAPSATLASKLALKRLHRSAGRAQAQAAPLHRARLELMLAAAGDTPRDRRDKALLAVAYDTLCRRSELVALRIEDLEGGPEGDGTIALRRSKTDPEGEGAVRFLAPDTMQLLTAWLDGAGLTEGPLFRAVRKGGGLGGSLAAAEVARRFKAMAARAGVDAAEVARISGHSSRVGAAQDMARHGLELPAIMQAGGWRTATMVARYTQRIDARASGAARLAALQRRG